MCVRTNTHPIGSATSSETEKLLTVLASHSPRRASVGGIRAARLAGSKAAISRTDSWRLLERRTETSCAEPSFARIRARYRLLAPHTLIICRQFFKQLERHTT